jgi:hypothetical protein
LWKKKWQSDHIFRAKKKRRNRHIFRIGSNRSPKQKYSTTVGIWVSGPRVSGPRQTDRKRVISTKRRIVLVLAMTMKTGKVPGKLSSVHCPVLP